MSEEIEKQDNEHYSKNFTRIPNILFDSYKYLSKEEKFLYCSLRFVYWDTRPRYVSLRELSDLTGYSIGALSKMLPRLHSCGLIHAEIRREKAKNGKEKGNSKYHITIIDIWEENRKFYSCSPNEQVDPSAHLVHQMTQACSPNDTSLFTKCDKPVHEKEQGRAQLERAKKDKDTLKKDKDITVSSSDSPDQSHLFENPESSTVPEGGNLTDTKKQAGIVSPIATETIEKPVEEKPPRKPRASKNKPVYDEVTQKRIDRVYEFFDQLRSEVSGKPDSRYRRTESDTKAIVEWLENNPTEEILREVYLELWNTPDDKRTNFSWQKNMWIHSVLKQYEIREMAILDRRRKQASKHVNYTISAKSTFAPPVEDEEEVAFIRPSALAAKRG